MNHTPGPWTLSFGGSITDHGFTVTNGADVIAERWPYYIRNQAELAANARLIAAAPELLAALEAAMRISDLWMPPECFPPEHQEEAAALAAMAEKIKGAIEKARTI
jgi:hypothetical protein